MTIIRHEQGSRMSQAVIHNRTVYLAGQVGKGATTADQTRDLLTQVERLLALSNSDKSLLLSATIWLADMEDFAQMNAVWDAWVDPRNPPARACGEVRLASPDYRVEMLIVAAQRA
ncbi:MAG: RidA family protein [Burkholderiaceae bacterium]